MDQYKRGDGQLTLAKRMSVKNEGSGEVAQLKSEIILLKRHNERLLKKEKRLQVKEVDLFLMAFQPFLNMHGMVFKSARKSTCTGARYANCFLLTVSHS